MWPMKSEKKSEVKAHLDLTEKLESGVSMAVVCKVYSVKNSGVLHYKNEVVLSEISVNLWYRRNQK
jgi:hypothetical protein